MYNANFRPDNANDGKKNPNSSFTFKAASYQLGLLDQELFTCMLAEQRILIMYRCQTYCCFGSNPLCPFINH